MEKHALEALLETRASLSTEQIRLVTESSLFALSEPPAPGTDEAVASIYSLDEAAGLAHIAIAGVLSGAGPSLIDRIFGVEGTAYQTIRAACKKAASQTQVKGIILDIDSPGGEVGGLDETWQAIKALNDEKPVTVSGGSMVASAAYYLAAAASKIYATGAGSMFGSIGIMAAFYDNTAALEADGYKKITLVSKNAPAKDAQKPVDGEYVEIQKRLDALERIFYDRISQGRSVTAAQIAEHFGRGGLLVAKDPSAEHKDAIRAGMIDGLTSNRAGTIPIQAAPINVSTQAGASAVEIPFIGKERIMTLQEMLGQSAAAKAEFDALIASAKTSGRDEARQEFQAKAERCAVYVASENYPTTVRKMAAEVLAGKKEMAALEAVVAYADMEAEKAASANAQTESGALPAPVPPAPTGETAEEKQFAALSAAALEAAKAKKEGVQKWA